nr:hypothetical protein [Escherichia coli]
TVIRSVAETTWDYGHYLPARCNLTYSQCNKGGIQIYRLDTDSAKSLPVG